MALYKYVPHISGDILTLKLCCFSEIQLELGILHLCLLKLC